MSSLAVSRRFDGALNVDVTEFQTDLVPIVSAEKVKAGLHGLVAHGLSALRRGPALTFALQAVTKTPTAASTFWAAERLRNHSERLRPSTHVREALHADITEFQTDLHPCS